ALQGRRGDPRRQHEQGVVVADLVRPQLARVLRQELPGDPGLRLEQPQADVAEADRAVRFEEVAGHADAKMIVHASLAPLSESPVAPMQSYRDPCASSTVNTGIVLGTLRSWS